MWNLAFVVRVQPYSVVSNIFLVFLPFFQFLREELKYENGAEKRQRAFHHNDDMHISVKELWEAWVKSEVSWHVMICIIYIGIHDMKSKQWPPKGRCGGDRRVFGCSTFEWLLISIEFYLVASSWTRSELTCLWVHEWGGQRPRHHVYSFFGNRDWEIFQSGLIEIRGNVFQFWTLVIDLPCRIVAVESTKPDLFRSYKSACDWLFLWQHCWVKNGLHL